MREFHFPVKRTCRRRAVGGRSALDAVELMDVGGTSAANICGSQRSHYVITDGGDQPNVVPSERPVWYYFREIDSRISRRYIEVAIRWPQAAAKMTDTTVDHNRFSARHGRRTSTRPLPK